MARVPLVGGTNVAIAVQSSAQRTINWLQQVDQNAKYPLRLTQRPGLGTFSNGGSSGVRNAIRWGSGIGDLYVVVGDRLQKINTSGTATAIGTLNTNSGTVGMAAGTTQFMITDGTNGYFSDGSTLTVITDSDYPDTATQVVWLDSYFVVEDPTNDGRAYRSDANDASSWGALNFATAERDPDPVVALTVRGRELWLMGSETTEVFYNDGSSGFSFAPLAGGLTGAGCHAPFSVASDRSTVFWLASSDKGGPAVMMARGIQGVRVSTHAIEEDIHAVDSSNAIGDVIYHKGSLLYILTLADTGRTLVFDAGVHAQTGNGWSEWKSYLLSRFRGQHFVHFNDEIYCGDFQDGNVWQMLDTNYSDNGLEIECERTDRVISDSADHALLQHNELELEMSMGVGSLTANPKVMISWSDDGGQTFGTEIHRNLGLEGNYDNRILVNNLGSARDRVYRVRMTDPFPKNLLGAYLDLTP